MLPTFNNITTNKQYNNNNNTYTLNDLFSDLAKDHRKDQYVLLRRDNTYAACWGAICEILDAAVDKQRNVVIPGFGSVYYRVFNLGICIPFFEIDDNFVRLYELNANKKKMHQRGGSGGKGSTIKINRKIGSQYSGIDPKVFEMAYKRMFTKIGLVMKSGLRVDINFRVGNMICEDLKPVFNFQHRVESKNKTSMLKTNNRNVNNMMELIPLDGSTYQDDRDITTHSRITTATSTLSHIPNTSRRIKLEHVPQPPPKGTKRRIGDTGKKMPAGGRLLKNPSDATLVALKFEKPKPILSNDEIQPNPKYPALLDAFTRTELAVIEDIIYLRKVADRIGGHYTPEARSIAFDLARGTLVHRSTDPKAPTASDGYTDILLSPRALSNNNVNNGRGGDGSNNNGMRNNQGGKESMLRREELVGLGNDSNNNLNNEISPFLGMSNANIIEEDMLSFPSKIDDDDGMVDIGRNFFSNGNDNNNLSTESRISVREIMQLKQQIWTQISTNAISKTNGLQKALAKHQAMMKYINSNNSNNVNINVVLRKYFNNVQEDDANDGCNDIDNMRDEDLIDLLHVNIRSNTCRYIMWKSLQEETLRLLNTPSGKDSATIEDEKRAWSDDVKNMLAIINEKVVSSRTHGDELLLEELEHFRHELLFALQVNVHVVLRKMINKSREEIDVNVKDRNNTSPYRKSKALARLEKMQREKQRENPGPLPSTRSFLNWINFTLDDMREELSERLSNNDANCMNDEDQALRSRLSRDLHAAQRRQLLIAMGDLLNNQSSNNDNNVPENENYNYENEKDVVEYNKTIQTSLERYLYYADNGVPDYKIPPLNEQSLMNILEFCKSNIIDTESETAAQQFENVLMEVKSEYKKAVRRSILQYILKSPFEQKRLRIFKLPSYIFVPEYGWGAQRILPFDPPTWHDAYEESRMLLGDNLFVTAPQMSNIMSLWEHFREKYMIDLPLDDRTAQKSNWHPQTIEEFQQRQVERITSIHDDIIDEWMPGVVNVFNEADQNGMFVNVPQETLVRFFNSVAILMAINLRELVLESLTQYVNFFERFSIDRQGTSERVNNYANEETIQQRCAMRLDLTISGPFRINEEENEDGMISFDSDGEQTCSIKFKTSLDELHGNILKIFDRMVRSLNGIKRVEHRIGSLNFPSQMDLLTIDLEEHDVATLRNRLNDILTMTLEPVSTIFESYSDYTFLLDEQQKLNAFFESEHSIEEYGKRITRYRAKGESITNILVSVVPTDMILLCCEELNSNLAQKSEALAQSVLNHVARLSIDDSATIRADFKQVLETVQQRSGNSHELVAAETFMKKFTKEILPSKLKDVRGVKDKIDFLYDYRFNVSERVLEPAGIIFNWALNIRKYLSLARIEQGNDRKALEDQFNDLRNAFVDQVQELHDQVSLLFKEGGYIDPNSGGIKKAGEMKTRVDEYFASIKEYDEKCIEINDEEERLGFAPSTFPTLDEARFILDPYFKLWNAANLFQRSYGKWMKGPVHHLVYEDVVKVGDDLWKQTRTLGKLLAEKSEKAAKLSVEICDMVGDFKQHYDLLSAICNTGLRDRHWKDMSDVVGFTLIPDDHTTLGKLLNMGVGNHVKQLLTCAESATKESSIEKNLVKMRAEWEDVVFVTKPYKDTGAYIVTGQSVDEVQMILDDQIMKTQTMSSSAFAKPFAKEMSEWQKYLTYMESLLEAWLKVQGTWLYLEPIFTSEDIVRQMPEEADQFKVVDGGWRLTMKQVNETPRCLDVYEIDGLLQRLEEANGLLEVIQKGLSNYLTVKRIHFPRFFFLSDDELLEILAETKDPTKVQPFLKKCFDGLNGIEFNEAGDVIAMRSAEKEVVQLVEVVSPAEAQGAVEKWLLQLESIMRDTVKDVVQRGIEDYPTKERISWVQEWPGQVVLCVSQLYWTRQFEEGILERGNDSLADYTKQLTGYIDNIVSLVRGKLSKMLRKTLSALIIMDVHARDTVADACKDVSNINDFAWQSQLRYYWEENTLRVRMIVSDLEYGYEYLGNSGRLVITPLTDRCYRTLMGAIHLQYGGAPEGPAGTGKTETTKDLSKALARQCVVYNCSDGLDYLAMAKFFKGLASAGAWACFDEFNRIVLEVLSVVAQQITTIQQAVAARKTSFTFYGTELSLKWTCNVFITMNPGYAGRAELPDNLKSLFRTVAMMVPDYAMIAEIILYSFGFRNSRAIATKIVTTFTLCSEQLSSQSHYDYGMRAVMSVLRAAGNLKRKFPDDSEDIVALRAINDVNKAKFLSQDLSLFAGITSDLFPGVVLPQPDYKDLMEAIERNIALRKLQPSPVFIEKLIQTYEMMVVRHGFMIVGKALAGKTECYRILQGCLNDLCKAGKMPCALNPEHELETEITVINPKSISMDRLYGCFDSVTHEWSDGVLAIYYRAFASSTTETRKWTVFDGPVDAIWIENMNTVLDDNKKLCLMTGEMLQMNDYMSMIFENLNLDAASPATVSRCGMVYMDPDQLGYEPVLESWLNTLPEFLSASDAYRGVIVQMFNWLIPACTNYLFRKQAVKSMLPVEQAMLSRNAMSLMFNLLDEFNVKDKNSVTETISPKQVNGYIESLMIFSVAWSYGGILDAPGRNKFDSFLRGLLKGENEDYPRARKIQNPLPRRGSIFDCVWEKKGQGKWVMWEDKIEKKYVIPDKSRVSEIVVPTIDTCRYTYLLNLSIEHRKHLLFVGPTGTGKTVYINAKLMKGLDSDAYKIIQLGFSAQTSAAGTQSIIDGKLDKRRKNVYGPPPTKQCIIFVDDLNMPMVETYGAQPPLELIRQAIVDGGWYDSKTSAFRKVVETFFLSAMGPPGGGRNDITPRLLRHYQVFGMNPIASNAMERIFGTIIEWHLSNGYDASIKPAAWPIVKATSHIYEAASASLLPTPSKSHYTFNLRDFARVIFGMTMVGAKEMGKDKQKIMRLWVHEVLRVFSDRLVNDEDRLKLFEMVHTSADRHLSSATGGNFDACLKCYDSNRDGKINTIEESRQIIYGDFMNPQAINKRYDEVPVDAENTMAVMTSYLEEYNTMSNKPMNLVLFMFAVEHAARIGRVLKTPGGHALLVGVGGSGRQSLTRLVAFMGEYELTQIEISKGYGVVEFQDDLKKVMIQAGGEGKESVFLLSDTQITNETFVENISSLLNTGDVPNIYAADEIGTILELARKAAKKEKIKLETVEEIYAYFVDCVKRNLHIVLAFSPIGDAFRERLRKFPSLVNCCTIDWFSVWPDDALLATANSFLKTSSMEESVKKSAVVMCMHFHSSTVEVAAKFYKQLKRHYHVTPTSYLSLITTFIDMLKWKTDVVENAKRRYEIGLEKIETTESAVGIMQVELEELQPQLIQTAKETAEMMIVVEKETADAQIIRENVAKEEAKASEQADAAQAMKSECEADLAEAMPILQKAIKALNTLSKNDITEVKAMKTPPSGVIITMEAVCLMMSVKPARSRDDKGKVQYDYWEPAKKDLLGDSKFLKRLIDYDKDNIPQKIMDKVSPFVLKPEFEPAVVKKASVAAYGLCCWVRAMVSYDRVAKVVKPKKIALRAAEDELAVVMKSLAKKQAELQAVEDKLDALDRELKRMEKKKEDLEENARICVEKIDRAEKLLGGLGGEKARWRIYAKELGEQLGRVVGDMLIASASIAYSGAFTAAFRAKITKNWLEEMDHLAIPYSTEGDKGYNLVSTMGDPVKIRAWNIAGLPVDSFSVENGMIMSRSSRWPLMIDPQGQANKWIRNLEKDSYLKVIKQSESNYLRTLESAIQFGQPVLLENIGESLDASLEPLLLRQVFKSGGVMSIRLGDKTIEYSEKFRFFMTTMLSNPHYLPETSVKVTIINFMITSEGLQDQLLGVVVAKERPELEQQKNQLIIEGAENKRKLKEIEDKILHILSSSEGNILEDSAAIDVLTVSKTISDEITEKQKIAEQTEVRIDAAREVYIPVAIRSTILFFVVSSLAVVEPMYQYSLGWFNNLFTRSIAESEKSNNIRDRIMKLNEYFTYAIYRNVCQSLFEKDKLLFAFLMTTRIVKNLYEAIEAAKAEKIRREQERAEEEARAAEQAALEEQEGDEEDGKEKKPVEEKKKEKLLKVGKKPEKRKSGLKMHSLRGEIHTRITDTEMQFLLAGSIAGSEEGMLENPCVSWLRAGSWRDIYYLGGLLMKAGAPNHIGDNFASLETEWKQMYDSASPETMKLPGDLDKWTTPYQKLCILRCIRPDRLTPALTRFVATYRGEKYTQPPGFDLASTFKDSTNMTPLVFILSPGTDPIGSINAFAAASSRRLDSLSLGQGQGPVAERMIKEAVIEGSWVVLQNCHLFPSWMSKLDAIVENMEPQMTHESFRLWLTSYPSNDFPVAILRSGVKLTNEPPKGIRANLLASLNMEPISKPDFFEGCSNAGAFKKMVFALCFFHAIVQERVEFGPIGWNIPYEFTASDLIISVRQLRFFLDSSEKVVPFDALKYIIGQCNYGGRVTDDKDRTCITTILANYFSPMVLRDSSVFSPSGIYYAPPEGPKESYIEYVQSLPLRPEPEVFGLHENANIAKDEQETNKILTTLLLIRSTSGGSSSKDDDEGESKELSPEETMYLVAETTLAKMKPVFNMFDAMDRYPITWDNSMNTVLVQELERFNALNTIIQNSLSNVMKAVKGIVVMSKKLEEVAEGLLYNKTPKMWLDASYPSLKPMGSYVADFLERLDFFQKWLDNGSPAAYWLSGFYFTQAFLTGNLQNYARKYTIPIDILIFDFEPLTVPGNEITEGPEDGAYIYGLFFDGASWDFDEQIITDSKPKKLYSDAPAMWFKPIKKSDKQNKKVYKCPVYKTSERRGTLSTTGHSTNFVLYVEMPTERNPGAWTEAGVSMLTTLDD